MTARAGRVPLVVVAAAATLGALLGGNFPGALVLALLTAVCRLAVTMRATARRRDASIDQLLRRDARHQLATPATHVRPRIVALPPRQGTDDVPKSGWGR